MTTTLSTAVWPSPSRKKWAKKLPFDIWGCNHGGRSEPVIFAGCRTYAEAREVVAWWHEKFPDCDYWIVPWDGYVPARTAAAVNECESLVRRTMAQVMREAADRVERRH